MIKFVKGNLLEEDVEVLINTVNTVGVMGKGIALQFKQAFPDNFIAYQKACKNKSIVLGKIFVVPTHRLGNPKYIFNFPTKSHWRSKTKLEDIDEGLKDLKQIIEEYQISSIAIPPLGCGFGGLNWRDVKPRIVSVIGGIDGLFTLVYEPSGAPKPDHIKIGTNRPNMTPGRAALVKLIHEYSLAGYRLTLLEVQKLAYLLQEMGQPLRLNYVKQKYGPYAENLNYVLQRIEGHFIRGYGDRSGKRSAIYLLPSAIEEADEFLSNHPETTTRINEVTKIIRGFETPYGMELLSTVFWLANENSQLTDDLEATISAFTSWNQRKQAHFRTEHIHTAWKRLKEEAWSIAG